MSREKEMKDDLCLGVYVFVPVGLQLSYVNPRTYGIDLFVVLYSI